MEKNLFIGYDEKADELIITTNPKARTVGYFVDSGVAILLGMKDMRPYGLSFLFLKKFFKQHPNKAFSKIPLTGKVVLPVKEMKRMLG